MRVRVRVKVRVRVTDEVGQRQAHLLLLLGLLLLLRGVPGWETRFLENKVAQSWASGRSGGFSQR